MEKLEIGKTEIVIYPEKGLTYLSPKDRNGIIDQEFNSSNLPKTLKALYMGKEKVKGILYEKYILKTIPGELKEFLVKGESGFVNLSRELNSVAGILQGKAKDGRKIRYVRSMDIKDVNKLFKIIIKNKKVYQKGREKIDINRRSNFGCRFNIDDNFTEELRKIIRKHIKSKKIKSTAYTYHIEDLHTDEYLKELILLPTPYYLNSTGVYVHPGDSCGYSSSVDFGYGAIGVGSVYYGYGNFFHSDGIWDFVGLAVRPVFFLESRKK